MEVFDAKTGKSKFWAYQDEYLPRNSGATSFFAFSWDGTTTPGKEQPDYSIVLRKDGGSAVASLRHFRSSKQISEGRYSTTTHVYLGGDLQTGDAPLG